MPIKFQKIHHTVFASHQNFPIKGYSIIISLYLNHAFSRLMIHNLSIVFVHLVFADD